MKTALSTIVLSVAAFTLIGCGSAPSKEDVCGGCTEENAKSVCEVGYDACADTDCDLNDYKDTIDAGGVCG